ncbi:hypothetical protein EV700_1482 [Fluviicoccus keumensis]|uniref:Uncharacterized protein n=1 Tax=Fluviicoccus keumensis TaxID=1435465 RepID=A0A4Q7ZAH7_9GAMM|nr:hypothetical protein [Fluviicoccus keumensis]RZU47091.1 hypothetical protein EV700_1482 [Fluviicoccus keumensis]
MKNWLFLSALFLSNAVMAADMPAQGMSMTAVQKQFGAPLQKSATIGKPPITRWVYKDFTVVFEYKHVVHSMVVKNESAPSATPAAAPAATSGKGEASLSVDVK